MLPDLDAWRRPSTDAPWQPELTRWPRTWRLLLMLVISVSVVPSAWDAWQRMPLVGVVDVVLGVASFVIVRWRRERPFTIAVVLAAFGLLSVTSAGPSLLAAASLATRRQYDQIVAVVVVTVAAGVAWAALVEEPTAGPWWVSPLAGLIVTVVLVVFGMFVGSRRELLWTLRERAERAEAEQALRVDQARATERERIAREMHDVLGHRISLVTMHAGALSFRDDLDRGQVTESAQVILDNAQLAMTDLRSVLGVLRGDPGETGERPQPTLGDLPHLVAETEQAGARATLDLAVDERVTGPVPDALGRTAYRVVQEGLTNVRKHAPGVTASVRVSGGPEEGLRVRVENPVSRAAGRRTPPGFGMVGLAERAALLGGTIEHGFQRGDTFVLEVWLPWTR